MNASARRGGDLGRAPRDHEAHSLVMEAYQATGRAKAEGAATFIADTLAGGADKIICLRITRR